MFLKTLIVKFVSYRYLFWLWQLLSVLPIYQKQKPHFLQRNGTLLLVSLQYVALDCYVVNNFKV